VTDVDFPSNLPVVASIADLRALPSSDALRGDLYQVRGVGFYSWDAGSLAADDGDAVLRPNDLTPLQAGRWLFGPQGATGPADNTYTTLAALMASDPARKSARLVPDPGETAPAGNFSNATGMAGAWERQSTDGLTFQQDGTGSTSRRAQLKMREIGISPRDFGAVADGMTDDSAAVQKAIGACLLQAPPAPLRVDGYFGLSSPLMINRPIDSAPNTFALQGLGRGAGFRLNAAVNMFDTTVPYPGSDPVVGEITMRDLNLVAASATQASQTLTAGKFANVTFSRCNWFNLKCVGAAIYTQGFRFRDCRALYWQGVWFESRGTYDLAVDGLRTKFGGGVFLLQGGGANRPIFRASVENCVIEGTGAFMQFSGSNGLTIAKNYIEYNNANGLDMTLGPNALVIVKDNIFQQTDAQKNDPNYYDIRWGSTIRGISQGNFCDGKLHDTTGMTGTNLLRSNGDVTTGELYRGFRGGPTDPAWAAVGNVDFALPMFGMVSARGTAWTATKSGIAVNGLAQSPGTLAAGELHPVRDVRGPTRPDLDSSPYGGGQIGWGTGSYVRNSAPAVGQPKGWICTAGGVPGTWVADSNL
jgi:hypothetical protein